MIFSADFNLRTHFVRKPYVNVTRWFTTVINQPNVKAVIGEQVLCSKMAEFDSKKFAEFSGKFSFVIRFWLNLEILVSLRFELDTKLSLKYTPVVSTGQHRISIQQEGKRGGGRLFFTRIEPN